jgi:hypothetical protein
MSSDEAPPPRPPPPPPDPDFEPLLSTELSKKVETYQKWLAPPDPSTNHWIAHKARQEDTNKWFLNGDAYKAWKTNGTLYWVRGKFGAGKTFLTCVAL